MAAITDRSTQAPLLKTGRLNHGTLHCLDIAKTRRFYEEVLGLEVIQTSPISLMVRKGTEHVYAVVEQPAGAHPPMTMLNHNGFEVGSAAEVQAAYELLIQVKDDWGIKKIMPLSTMHGDTSFYFMDQDNNWWEIVAVPAGGYLADFEDKANWDLSGRHDLQGFVETWEKDRKLRHMHDPETRALLEAAKKT